MSDSLFTLDIVRDFIITKGGKVTNHELVTHFKRFLNDTACKVANREKFKDFVNTLASVKLDESGEKVLVLKKKYRDGGCSSTVAGTPGGFHVQERGPRVELQRPKAKLRSAFTPSAEDKGSASSQPPPSKIMASGDNIPQPHFTEDDDESTASLTRHDDKENVPEYRNPPPVSEHSIDISGVSICSETDTDTVHDSVFISPQTSEKVDVPSTETVSELMRLGSPIGESSTDHIQQDLDDQAHLITPPAAITEDAKTPVSVKDRARHLNRMSSDTEIVISPTSTSPVKREMKGRGSREDDSNSVSSVGIAMDATEREWMITCAEAEYHPIHKLLQKSPALAKRKDFITGFTALHWAAKTGNADVIKLLCGTAGNIEINAKSHGGYTALHLASMQGHEEVIRLLVQGYGADPNIRDYSGKRAKQYLRNSASQTSHQLLASRRLTSITTPTINTQQNPTFKRKASYSAKIHTSGFFGISVPSTVRNSWSAHSDGTASDRERSGSPSPSPSPKSSPGVHRKTSKSSRDLLVPRQSAAWTRRGSLQDGTMPPPKNLPNRRKKKNSQADSHIQHASSDGDMHLHNSDSDSDIMATSSSKSRFI